LQLQLQRAEGAAAVNADDWPQQGQQGQHGQHAHKLARAHRRKAHVVRRDG
jgi:hypothetical protein